MAITNYNRECSYRLGRLCNHVYFIDKSVKLKYLADGLHVELVSPLSEVKRCKTYLTVFNQSENEYGKYRFENTLEMTLLEEYTNALYPVLKNLRLNNYYVIMEDLDGTQYIMNPDADINVTYEYQFTSADEEQNKILISLKNIQNHPLLIVNNNVKEYTDIYESRCDYNFSQSYWLRMTLFGDLKIKDDNGELVEVSLDDPDKIKTIDFLPKSFSMTENYENGYFTLTIKFNVELSEFKYTFPYNLIEFPNNRYSAVFATHNHNLIFCGINSPLVPKYQITTSEDDGTLNVVTITLTSVSLYPALVRDYLFDYRWVDANDNICVGWDLYQQLKQQASDDFGASWNDTGMPYILGELIEKNSRECGWHEMYRWVDAGEGCFPEEVKEIWRFVLIEDDYICENGCKYEKLEKYVAVGEDGEFAPTGEFVLGNKLGESSDCEYIAVQWIEDGIWCETIIEELSYYEASGEPFCNGEHKYQKFVEKVTYDGINYYESGNYKNVLLEINSCDCGYYTDLTDYIYVEDVCGSEIEGDEYIDTNKYKKEARFKLCGDVQTDIYDARYTLIEENSYDCGFKGTKTVWKLENDDICGNALPEGTVEVDEPPLIN